MRLILLKSRKSFMSLAKSDKVYQQILLDKLRRNLMPAEYKYLELKYLIPLHDEIVEKLEERGWTVDTSLFDYFHKDME